jgi:dipeptide/tripeptide permease
MLFHQLPLSILVPILFVTRFSPLTRSSVGISTVTTQDNPFVVVRFYRIKANMYGMFMLSVCLSLAWCQRRKRSIDHF